MSNIRQGVQAGRQWSAEMTRYTDEETGAVVRRLTDSRAHDHHLYFTNSGWYDDNEKLVFGSDRTGQPNLFSVDLETWQIIQLTDLPPLTDDHEVRGHYKYPFLHGVVHPDRPELYTWYDDTLIGVNLEEATVRTLWEKPADFDATIVNVTADGDAICTSLTEDPGVVGFYETWEASPLSQVIEVPVEGGDAITLHEEERWIGHVNTSPTRPELLTFCHEGPWDLVDNRIWGLNRETGDVWPIREREEDGERRGHEYWLAGGEDIGYHGLTADDEPIFGFTRHDNSEQVEVQIEPDSWHFHSNSRDLMVGDGSLESPYVYLYEFDGEDYLARQLCRHRGSWHVQGVHVHARFNHDASRVLFTSDDLGYGNVYLAEVPDSLESLPKAGE